MSEKEKQIFNNNLLEKNYLQSKKRRRSLSSNKIPTDFKKNVSICHIKNENNNVSSTIPLDIKENVKIITYNFNF